MSKDLNSLIHVAKSYAAGGRWQWLFLRKMPEGRYLWHRVDGDFAEKETNIVADSAEEALRLAWQAWKRESFTFLRCGFRFTLPERDEIGDNALFHQMVASYSTVNGVYLDQELGHQCVVHDASKEALALWAKLRSI